MKHEYTYRAMSDLNIYKTEISEELYTTLSHEYMKLKNSLRAAFPTLDDYIIAKLAWNN